VVAEDDDRAEYDEVEDPEALRRAEEAVSHSEPDEVGPAVFNDETWVGIAWQDGSPAGVRGLQDVVLALTAEGIESGWDPHDPLEPAVGPYTLWQQGVPTNYAVLVPASQLVRGLQVLGSPAPDGVGYASPESAVDTSPTPAGLQPPVPAFTPVTSYSQGHALSDNARLEGATRPGARTTFATAVAVVVVVLIVVVVLLVLKG
jgi:hypothetical protein